MRLNFGLFPSSDLIQPYSNVFQQETLIIKVRQQKLKFTSFETKSEWNKRSYFSPENTEGCLKRQKMEVGFSGLEIVLK